MSKNESTRDQRLVTTSVVLPKVDVYESPVETYEASPVLTSEMTQTTRPHYVVVQKYAQSKNVVLVLSVGRSEKEELIRRANDLAEHKITSTSVSSGS